MDGLAFSGADVAIDASNLTAAANASSWLIVPSAKDLLMVVPRAVSRATGLISDSYELVESLFSGEIREQAIAAATGGAGVVRDGSDVAAANAAAGGPMSYLRAFNLQQLRTFGGIFNYTTSKWGICCFIVAIILNRTSVYAATRRHLRLRWEIRFVMRSIPIALLLLQIVSALRGIRCQTSPDFSMMRYGVEDKLTNLDFSQDGGFLYRMSSALLIGEDNRRSCLAVGMIPRNETADVERPDGSLTLLWPAFKTLCFSKFIEVLSSTIQGLPSATETGMSLFEHSLAYAETESMIGNLIGIGPLSAPTTNGTNSVIATILGPNATDSTVYLSRGLVLSKFNTSPEVLLITLISLCNSVSSHLLGILNKQAQFRLISTGVWGICFLGCFVWAFNTFSIEKMLDSGIFRFPTVCVVGFFPHLLIVGGIVLCTGIYLLALVISVISPPPSAGPFNHWTDRLRPMYDNMQANMQLSNVRVNMREDFYTALLRLGLSTLTAASEAVFLNEGRHINLGPRTWLEEERLTQLTQSRGSAQPKGPVFVGDAADDVASGVQLSDTQPQGLVQSTKWQSGYSRERTTKILKNSGNLRGNDGVGTLQRHSRYTLAFNYCGRIFRLVAGWHLLTLNKTLDGVGIRRRPAWMRRMLDGPKAKQENASAAKPIHSLDFWVLSENGHMTLPKDREVDVEAELRKRLQTSYPDRDAQTREQDLDSRLYGWFKSNGWWGDRDNSGEYVAVDQDEDTTSVVSFATDASTTSSVDDSGWESEPNDDGRRTPTQGDFSSQRFSRESTPAFDPSSSADTGLQPADLIRLLDPQDLEARNEARILARHLASDGPVTRSRYASMNGNPSTRVLTSSRYARPPANFRSTAHSTSSSLASSSTSHSRHHQQQQQQQHHSSANGQLSAHEEAEILEFLILKARKERAQHAAGASRGSSSTAAGAGAGAQAKQEEEEDLFAGGPQCVVCQSSPRTIMAWPCRCLSLCEDCRISLAMNNFGNCVCCRQEVVGFSRLFVP